MKSETSLLFYVRKEPLLQPVIGVVSFLFMCANVFFWTLLVHLISPLLLIRKSEYEAFVEQSFSRLYTGWVASNEWWFHRVLGVHWELDETMKTDFDSWNLIISNHRSWVDVFVLFAQLKGRRPLPRVFMKQALFWMPLVGTATYIMGFPYMKRYSKDRLKKHPHLVGKDLETTRRSCVRLLNRPNSIMSFVEGTRFTDLKHQQQASPYRCLLKPKAGGVGFILQTMPQKIQNITDITVLYHQSSISGWDLLCGRIESASVVVREVALPATLLSAEYRAADQDREHFFTWFNLYWHDKDTRMSHQLDALRESPTIGLVSEFSEGSASQE